MFRLLAFALSTVLLVACRAPVSLQKAETEFYTPGIHKGAAIDSTLLAVTTPYSLKLDETMNNVLARSQFPLEKGQPESRLGNFVADLCYNTGLNSYQPTDGHIIDFCVLNNGGLRSILPEGDITMRHVYELMPFDNELVVVTLPPDSAASLLKYINDKGGVPVSNIRMKITNIFPEEILIGNAPYDKNRSYKVLTSDYLANGGDAMNMFSGAIKTESLGIKVRDAIINYLVASTKKQPYITAETDGRISK